MGNENFIKQSIESSEKENWFNALKQELITLKQTEVHDPHFDDININELTNEDLMIYNKLQKNALSKKEFEEYRRKISDWINENKIDPFINTRSNFAAYIGNKMPIKIPPELLKQLQNKK